MYLTQALHRARQQLPGATATVFAGRRRTYADMAQRVQRLAAGLQALGLGVGDRIGILSHNSDRYVESYLAAYWAGAVVNPINTRWSVAEIAYSLDDCDTHVLIVDDAHLPMLADLRTQSKALRTIVHAGDGPAPAGTTSYEALLDASPPADEVVRRDGDIAGVFYTGGTTGFPKGVVLTHKALYTNALTLLAEDMVSKGGVGLHAAPLFHLAGIALMNALMLRGSRHVIVPAFEPVSVLQAIAAEKVTDCVLVPTMIRVLVDHPSRTQYDTSSVRRMVYGASPIDEALLERALHAWPTASFFQAYGMTELSPVATVLQPEHHGQPHRAAGKLRSAGRATACAEVRILDDAGAQLPPGTVGQIAVRGPCTMLRYWNKPEETAAALRDGWMHTGDGGYLDDDGFLFVVDRLKDMIVSGAENVYSTEVENAILKHPAIAACAVIGVPDADWGERVHAVLVLRPGAQPPDLDALRQHTRQHIAGYKCPRSLAFVAALPLSAAGKVLKRVLRDPHWQGQARAVS